MAAGSQLDVYDTVWQQIQENVARTLSVISPSLRKNYKSIFLDEWTEREVPYEGCFQLLGFDFMVDSSKKVRKDFRLSCTLNGSDWNYYGVVFCNVGSSGMVIGSEFERFHGPVENRSFDQRTGGK